MIFGKTYSDATPKAKTATSPSKVIKNLQILRFVAAAMVLFEHMQYEVVSRPYFNLSHFHEFHPLFWAGGVDIFFVISGFIMFTIGRESFGQPHASAHFLLSRLVRVAPSYWLFTTLMVISVIVLKDNVNHNDVTLGGIAASYLFIPYVNAYGTYYPVLSLGWTLNFEIFFYLVFALGLLFRRTAGMAFLVLTLCLFATYGMVGDVHTPVLAFWCNGIVLEFLFGMGLAWLYTSGLRLHLIVGLIISAIGFGLVYMATQRGLDVTALRYRALWMGLPALMICGGLVLAETDHVPGRLTNILIFGGNISFALYLSHPFSMNLTALLFKKTHLDQPWLFIVIGSTVAVAAASLFYVYVEKPVTKCLNRHLNGLLARP